MYKTSGSISAIRIQNDTATGIEDVVRFLTRTLLARNAHSSHLLNFIPAEEHAAKIPSARDAIGDSDSFLLARTDVRLTSAKTGLSDVIAKANLYQEAGAEACFVEAPWDDDEKEIASKTKGYRVCNMIYTLRTTVELKAVDFPLVVHSLTALYASTRASVDVLETLKEIETLRNHLNKMATFEEFN